MDIELTTIEARVLGCLIEKERTTPEYYPMTLNSLVAACNQKSNRDPVMQLAEVEVEEALEGLRYTHHLAAQVSMAGSRVMKYKHDVLSRYEFGPGELAVLCALMLRGPQTAGELRSHTRRMSDFESPAEVKETLDALMHWGESAFVVRLPPQPGKREDRYGHVLCGEIEQDSLPATPGPESSDVSPSSAPRGRVEALEERVASLEAILSELQQAFDTFRAQF